MPTVVPLGCLHLLESCWVVHRMWSPADFESQIIQSWYSDPNMLRRCRKNTDLQRVVNAKLSPLELESPVRQKQFGFSGSPRRVPYWSHNTWCFGSISALIAARLGEFVRFLPSKATPHPKEIWFVRQPSDASELWGYCRNHPNQWLNCIVWVSENEVQSPNSSLNGHLIWSLLGKRRENPLELVIPSDNPQVHPSSSKYIYYISPDIPTKPPRVQEPSRKWTTPWAWMEPCAKPRPSNW